MKPNLARIDELVRREKDLNDRFQERDEAFRERELNLVKREERLRERELNLEQQGRDAEEHFVKREERLRERELNLEQQGRDAEENVSQGKQTDDLGAQYNDRPSHEIQKDLPNKHAIVLEDGPSIFFPPPAVSPSTPSFSKSAPVSPPPASPPPAAYILSSGPAQSQCLQPEIFTQDAANDLSYSCVKCARPDDQLMIACQNGIACSSRMCHQKGGGAHSGNDAWFHISHFNMTEAALYELTKSEEDWYCPMCKPPTANTDPDEYTMPDNYTVPDEYSMPDKYTMIKLRSRQSETPGPKKHTTTKRRRQAVTPDSKKFTNGEKIEKKSNRRKQAFWNCQLERAALIDCMATVIHTGDKTEQKYATVSEAMLARGYDRSAWQIKNIWNRELRAEAQRQGVPEDRRPKAGRKLVTGVQNPADRKRKREEKRRAPKESVEEGNTKKMEEKDGAEDAEGEQDAEGEEDAKGERDIEYEEDAEGEDCEEYYNDDDEDEDDEEGESKRKRQRFF